MRNGIVRKYIRVPDGNAGRGQPIALIMAKIDNDVVRLGISLCSPNDQFTRAKAIALAQQSYDSGKFTVPLQGCFTAFEPKIREWLKFNMGDVCHNLLVDNIRFAIREAIQADWWRLRQSMVGKVATALRNTVLG